MDQMINKIKKWAFQTNDVMGIIIVGSQARIENPADEFSDLDLILIVKNPKKYLFNTKWLNNIGKVKLTHIERTLYEDFERRVLFNNGLAVDFVPVPSDFLTTIKKKKLDKDTLDIFSRGYLVLVDKVGFSKYLPPVESIKRKSIKKPSQDDFNNLVNDFLFHIILILKNINRGELWSAHRCLGGYLKAKCLLPMIEWYMLLDHQWNYDVWFNGRFMENWVDPKVLSAIAKTFPRYDEQDIVKALLRLLDFFEWLAKDSANKLGYSYPESSHDWVENYLKTNSGFY